MINQHLKKIFQFSFFRKELISKCIESINYKKIYRNNVTNMSIMFCGYSSSKELNLSNFNTNNVRSMSCMFSRCSDKLNKIQNQ